MKSFERFVSALKVGPVTGYVTEERLAPHYKESPRCDRSSSIWRRNERQAGRGDAFWSSNRDDAWFSLIMQTQKLCQGGDDATKDDSASRRQRRIQSEYDREHFCQQQALRDFLLADIGRLQREHARNESIAAQPIE
jgi:hypothetical protein